MPDKRQILRSAVVAAKGRHCAYCGKGPLYRRALHMDHIVPRSAGGLSDVDNLNPACRTCNTRKGTKGLQEYIVHRMEQLVLEKRALMRLARGDTPDKEAP